MFQNETEREKRLNSKRKKNKTKQSNDLWDNVKGCQFMYHCIAENGKPSEGENI